MNKLNFGRDGEKLACAYLKKQGYKIVEKNFTTAIGEIDIVCEKDGVIIFAEVKARSDEAFGLPREAVNYHKQKKYSQLAMQYIKRHNLFSLPCRFDVIEILGKEINHIKNAFDFIK